MNKHRAQNIILSTGRFDHEKDYWLKKLSGDLQGVHFPYDNPAPCQREHKLWQFTVPLEISVGLLNLSNGSHQRLYMTLLAITRILLYRYTGEEESVIVTPVERQAETGDFLNTLLFLRERVQGTQSFRDVLNQTRETVMAARSHQNYPYNLLLDRLGLQVEDLAQVGLILRELQESALLQEVAPKLVWEFAIEGGQVRAQVEYHAGYYDAATVAQIARHWLSLAGVLLASPDQEVGQVFYLSVEEREQVLRIFNTPAESYPTSNGTVVDLFELQVERMPEQLAVEAGDQQLTYRELNQRANQLAHHLLTLGVGPDSLIGVHLEPSLEIMIAILGILKAGGAYLPLDPNYPVERLRYMVDDARAEILLTLRQHAGQLVEEYHGHVLYLDEWMDSGDSTNPGQPIAPHNLAYCIYTSGSTGQPKGVLIEHRSLLHLIDWHTADVQITPADRFGKYASFSFDASVIEIFPYITAGATLVMVPGEYKSDLVKLAHWYEEKRITATFLPTNLGEIIGRDFPQLPLRYLIIGGDKIRAFLPATYPVLNCYGPTENTCVSTLFRLGLDRYDPASSGQGEQAPPIGKPLPDTQVYILDRERNPVPVNVVGEIYLAGEQLARGYLHQPELTAERFLPNPFRPGTRMYRTGDLGRWRPDGNIEFIGRVDHQVKIRGYRIELGEIEARLLSHPAIQATAVIPQPDNTGGLQLVGYLVLREKVQVSSLRAYLQESLPGYMVPSVFIALESLPLTANGKVDRKALPLPLQALLLTDREYTPPRNAIEGALAQIWADVLRVERVGIDDNFFELGGHSIKATQVLSRIYREMGVQIPVRAFFQAATIANLAETLRRVEKGMYQAIPVQPVRAYYPLTHAQKRLWILAQLTEGNIAYNMPAVFLLKGTLRLAAFRRAFQSIVERHEILRTRFVEVGGEPVQVVEEGWHFQLDYRPEFQGELQDLVTAELKVPFDLTQPCLFRASLTQINPEEHLLVTNMHHIISDGWSVSLMIQELALLYNAYIEDDFCPLEPLPIQYRDYAVWQNETLLKGSLAEQEQYWLSRLSGELTVLRLPYDGVGGYAESTGAAEQLLLTAELTDKLHALAQRQETTLFTVLTAALKVLFYKLTGKSDILIGISSAGRGREQLERLIGFFVNTLVLRSDLSDDPEFLQLLQQVRENAIAMYDNQDYPYDRLLEHLTKNGQVSGDLFTVMLNYLTGSDEPAIELAGLRVEGVSHNVEEAKFDLSLYIQELPDGVAIQALYRTASFTAETVCNWLEYWRTILDAVVQNPGSRLSEIQLVNAAEYSSILDDFNEDL